MDSRLRGNDGREIGASDRPLFYRDQLTQSNAIPGPAIITETNSTTIVEPGWQATVDAKQKPDPHPRHPLPKTTAIGITDMPIR